MISEPEMMGIPSGSFMMGSTMVEVHNCVQEWSRRLVDGSYLPVFEAWIMKEFPAYEKTVKSFAIGRFPITNEEYRHFVSVTGALPCESLLKNEGDNHPVWGLDLGDCTAYAAWMAGVHSKPYRLPSEWEWEYSARGPERNEYPMGDTFDRMKCNTVEAGIGGTTPVTQYAAWPSGFGVCDMAGNIEEWTASDYSPYPGGKVIADDLWEISGGSYPILRGGCFSLGGDLSRCARRHGPHPGDRFRYRGFRLALTI